MKQVWYGNIVLPDGILTDGQIIAEAGRIVYVGESVNYLGKHRNIGNYIGGDYDDAFVSSEGYLWPGLIDIHIHGVGGADVMDGSKEALTTMARTLLRYGVTGFLPTTLSAPIEDLKKILILIKNYKITKSKDARNGIYASYDSNGRIITNESNMIIESDEGEAEILGVHLEGPWLNPNYKGAHNQDFLQVPKKGEGKALFDSSQGELSLVTIAPEIVNGYEMIKELNDLGVIVSIGHSGATYEEISRAIDLGVTNITHTYNAMSGFHHRELGVVGSALLIDKLQCELIADGIHVHPLAIRGLYKLKGANNIILVSDGIRAVGVPEGIYNLEGLEVICENGVARLNDNTLAGSLLTLNKAVINMMNYAEVAIWETVSMASLNPARLLGLDKEIGSIEIGKRANIVAVDNNGDVKKVWIDGIAQKI